MKAQSLRLLIGGLLCLALTTLGYAEPNKQVDPVGAYRSVDPEGLVLIVLDDGTMAVAYPAGIRIPSDLPLQGDWKLNGKNLRVQPRETAERMANDLVRPKFPVMKPSVWTYGETEDGVPTYTFRSERALEKITFIFDHPPAHRNPKPDPDRWVEVDGKRLHFLATEENQMARSNLYVPLDETIAPYSRFLRITVMKTEDISPEAYAEGQQELNDNQPPDKLGEVVYDETSARWVFSHVYDYLQEASITASHSTEKGIIWSCYLAETGPDGFTVAYDYFVNEPIRGTRATSIERMLKVKKKTLPKLLKTEFKEQTKED